MASSSSGFHEPIEVLTEETKDRHRALVSLQEELEAIDWYDQRIEGSTDAALKEILRHNRDEEKEHASMLLEWLRRGDAVLDRHLRTYLFTEGPIRDSPSAAAGGGGDLGVGDVHGKESL